MASPLPPLTPTQTRVLGVLVEKQHTVPDAYPLSLNVLASGCNQKTSRDPVMSITEAEAQAAIDDLKRLSLVMEGSGSRVTRYEHNVARVLHLPPQLVATITVLVPRGPGARENRWAHPLSADVVTEAAGVQPDDARQETRARVANLERGVAELRVLVG